MSVLIYAENWDGKFKKLSFELVSYAAALAARLNCGVVALTIGNVGQEELQKLSQFGAEKILNVQDPRLNHLVNSTYASIIAQAAQAEQASVVLFAHNNAGKAIAPAVSVKLKAGLVFADPPYNKGYVKILLQTLLDNDILDDDALVVVELHLDEKIENEGALDRWQVLKEKKYGDTFVWCLQKAEVKNG